VNDPHLAALNRLIAVAEKQTAAIESLAAALRPKRDLSHEDHILLAKLLPGIYGTLGSTPFLTRELLADPVFRALVPPNMDASELGSLFSRAKNRDLGGLTIEWLGAEHGASIWRVVQTTLETTLPTSPPSRNGR
jgi:hypothetical protein